MRGMRFRSVRDNKETTFVIQKKYKLIKDVKAGAV